MVFFPSIIFKGKKKKTKINGFSLKLGTEQECAYTLHFCI